MSMEKGRIPVELSIGVVRKWKDTYQWIPVLGSFLAFTHGLAIGANTLPIPFSTPVASGALTMFHASLAACIINVPGTAFARDSNVDALLSDFLKENQPNEGFLIWSLVTVLITTTIWLALATYMELPVSPQESMQSSLIGTMLVTQGVHLPIWNGGKHKRFKGVGIIRIILEWTVAPPVAGVMAFCFFWFFKVVVLLHENAQRRILIFLPIYYGPSAGLLCFFLMYQVIPHLVAIQTWETELAVTLAAVVAAVLSLIVVVSLARKGLDTKTSKTSQLQKHHSPQNQEPHGTTSDSEEQIFEDALKDFMEMRVLDTVYEEEENASPGLIQSANEIASVVSPFQAIVDRYHHRAKYSGNGEETINASWWLRSMGGISASVGFFLCGWRLTHCLGGKVTYISNSRGLSSQLSTVAALVTVTRMKLPASSTISFIGSILGVGIADDPINVNWKLFLKFLCGWIGSTLFCCAVSYGLFSFSIFSPAYVVP